MSTVYKPCLLLALFALLELCVHASGSIDIIDHEVYDEREKIHPFPRDCRNDVLRNFLQDAEENEASPHEKQSSFKLVVTAVNGVPVPSPGDSLAFTCGDTFDSKFTVASYMGK